MDDPNAVMLDLDFCSLSLLPGNRVGKMYNGASAGFPPDCQRVFVPISFLCVYSASVFQYHFLFSTCSLWIEIGMIHSITLQKGELG